MQIIVLFIFYGVTTASGLLLLYAAKAKKVQWAYCAALLAIPVSYIVAGYPALLYIPLLFPLSILAGAIFLKQERTSIAYLFFAPYLFFCLIVFLVALVNLGP